MGRAVGLGASLSLTGRYARQGGQAAAGLRVWAQGVNAGGGLLLGREQRPVQLVVLDDGSRRAGLEANLTRLLDEQAVDVLFGPYGSDLALQAVRLARARGHLLWNHAGASDDVPAALDAVVNGIAPASSYFAALPRYLRCTDPTFDRLGILYAERGTFGRHVASGAAAAAQVSGLREVHCFPFAPPLEERPGVMEAVRAWRPRALICAGRFEDDVWLARRRDLGPDLAVVAAVAAGITAFGEAAGEAAEGVLGPSHWEPPVATAGQTACAAAAFAAAYMEAIGEQPDYPAALIYAMGSVLAACAARAGSLQGPALRHAAAALELPTLLGRFRLDPSTGQQVGYRPILVEWQGGQKRVVLGPSEVA